MTQLQMFKDYFNNQVGKHGSCGEFTDVRDAVDNMTNSELMDLILGDDWDDDDSRSFL